MRQEPIYTHWNRGTKVLFNIFFAMIVLLCMVMAFFPFGMIWFNLALWTIGLVLLMTLFGSDLEFLAIRLKLLEAEECDGLEEEEWER